MHFESEQHLLLVGEVADHPPQRQRQRFDEGRRREDLFVLGHIGKLKDIDDLEVVLTPELLLADAAEIGDGRAGTRARSGDEQPQQVL